MSLTDGLQWLKNKAKKIEKVFEKSFALNIKEGMDGSTSGNAVTLGNQSTSGEGILGHTNNLHQLPGTSELTGSFDKKNNQLGNISADAQNATNKFVTTNPSARRNYNVFINRTVGYEKIQETRDTKNMCVSSSILTGGGLNEVDSSFYSAYPNNFNNYNAAKDACKLWAADSGKNDFALSKSDDNAQFKCFTGSSVKGTTTPYIAQQIGTVLASSRTANAGGLMYDGTIGVYSPFNVIRLPNGTDFTNFHDVTNSIQKGTVSDRIINDVTTMTGGIIPNGYESCDKLLGGSINVNTINATFGKNCAGPPLPPFNGRYIIIKISDKRPNTDNYIMISQIAVYVYDDVTESIINVAPLGFVDGTTPWTEANTPKKAIDGNLGSKGFSDIYCSGPQNNPSSPFDYWYLDLKKNYPIFQIYYRAWDGCCSVRADGMKLVIRNEEMTKQLMKTMTGDLEQTFTIEDDQAQPAAIYPVMSPVNGYTFNGHNSVKDDENKSAHDIQVRNVDTPDVRWYHIVDTKDDTTTVPAAGAALCGDPDISCKGFTLGIDSVTGFPTGEIWLKSSMVGLANTNNDGNYVTYSKN